MQPFEDDQQRTSHRKYFVLTVEIKYYNFMIDGTNFFDHPVKNDATTCET